VPVPQDVHQEFSAKQQAEATLAAAVEKMREHLRVSKDTATIVAEIKKTMQTQLPSHGLTVFQVLYERERQDAFNREVEFNRETEADIRDFVIARDGHATAGKVRRLARNVWREDAAADRRAQEMERNISQKNPPQGSFRSPFRGRPPLYDREVVIAFADAIARVVEEPSFSWTRRVDDNKSEGVMLDVLVASVRWAMCCAQLAAGSVPSRPVRVTAEGLLSILRATKRHSRNRAD